MMTRLSKRHERALRYIRECAEAGKPAPTDMQIGEVAGRPERGGGIVREIASQGLLCIERKNSCTRRFVFPDGVATDWTDTRRNKSNAMRPCITCGRTFRSNGIGNRMCGECRNNSWIGEAYRIVV